MVTSQNTSVQLPGLVVHGSCARPIFVRPGVTGERALPEASRLLVHDALCDGLYRIFDVASGTCLAEARSLNGPWILCTAVAWETDRRLHSMHSLHAHAESLKASRLPAVSLGIGTNSPRPELNLVARIICLPERAAHATVLLEDLRAAAHHSDVTLDIAVNNAWDTRGISNSVLYQERLIAAEVVEEGDKISGCSLSHSSVWQALVQGEFTRPSGEPADMLLVLEDDWN